MLYVTLERVVRRPPPLVWRFVTDITNAPRWVDDLIEARLLGEVAVGAVVEARRRVSAAGKIERFQCELTALRPPTATASGLVALETRLAKSAVLYDRLTLDLVPEGTKLGVLTELHEANASLFARSPGLSAPTPLELTLRAAYRRSLETLALVVEREGDAPYR